MSPDLANRIAVYLEIVATVMAAFAVAFWLGMVVWTFRDIRARTHDPIAILLATALSLAFGPIGVLLYLLLRPKETLAEQYDRALEEEALLREIEDLNLCPGCRRPTREDWRLCPYCHTPLRRPCPECGRLIDLGWTLCPYCTADLSGEEEQTGKVAEGYVPEIPEAGMEGLVPNGPVDEDAREAEPEAV